MDRLRVEPASCSGRTRSPGRQGPLRPCLLSFAVTGERLRIRRSSRRTFLERKPGCPPPSRFSTTWPAPRNGSSGWRISRIGDPTGRSHTRPVLSPEEIDANAATYIEQVSLVLRTDPEVFEVRRNSEWFGGMSVARLMDLFSLVTHAQLVSRDMFRSRLAAGREIGLHELVYPVLQASPSTRSSTPTCRAQRYDASAAPPRRVVPGPGTRSCCSRRASWPATTDRTPRRPAATRSPGSSPNAPSPTRCRCCPSYDACRCWTWSGTHSRTRRTPSCAG